MSSCAEKVVKNFHVGSLSEKNQETIRSIELMIPHVKEKLKDQLQSIVSVAIETAVKNLKRDLLAAAKTQVSAQLIFKNLKKLSECEKLENYNR